MRGLTPTFQGEVMLAGWTETHNGGAKIVLWLPDPLDLEVFRGLTVRKGNTAGHRFACVLVEINDDETPKAETDAAVTAAAKDAPRGGELSKLAGMWCNTPAFRSWLFQNVASPDGDESDAEAAARIVRDVCGVASRAELDHNAEAAKKFHAKLRLPYAESCE